MPSTKQKTILLVEDEVFIAESESEILESSGYKVIRVLNGESAIGVVRNGHVDLVLMDIDLGKGMDGTQAAREILGLRDVPLVFISSHTEEEFIRRTDGILSYGYITKNSGAKILVATLSMAFRLYDAHQRIQSQNAMLEIRNRDLKIALDEVVRTKTEVIRSEERYRMLFENMVNGFVYCKSIFDKGLPVDFLILDVNGSFEKQTGLTGSVGHRISEVLPGIYEMDPALFDICGRVSLSGNAERKEVYISSLNSWFSVSIYSPEKEYFVAMFDDITIRKNAEKELQESESRYRDLFEKSRTSEADGS